MISTEGGSNVSIVRELCLGIKPQDAMTGNHYSPFYGEIDYDYIMWIDSDMIFKPEDVEKLISHNVDIVSGLCKRDPYTFAFSKLEDKPFSQIMGQTEADIPDKLFEVKAVGAAFLLVKRGVFESIKRPWFSTTLVENDFVGEDVYFCIKAREAGYKIWIDPSVKIKHLKLGSL
jgi:GT2 family glycosyltransferase